MQHWSKRKHSNKLNTSAEFSRRYTEMESKRDWCLKLPVDIWELKILSRLSLKDLIRSAAVCHSWRSIAIQNQYRFHRLPWLMIPSQDNQDSHMGTFFNLVEGKTYHLKLTPTTTECFCCGSSQGNLIMTNRNGIFVFNPFSQTKISLPKQYIPPQDAYYGLSRSRFYFRKAILSPTSPHVVAALSYDSLIVEMCRPNDPEWSIYGAKKEESTEVYEIDIDTRLEKPSVVRDKEYFLDILFYKGMLYGLTHKNRLLTFELQEGVNVNVVSHEVLEVSLMSWSRANDVSCVIFKSYLVESSCGELLMICRFASRIKTVFVTKEFGVYKLDQSSESCLLQWVRVQSLGDEMLFLGKNSSMSISAAGIPGFKGNCIYFTDDAWPFFPVGGIRSHICSDNGVFYLDDGHIERFLPDDYVQPFKSQPVWVFPNNILGDRLVSSSCH